MPTKGTPAADQHHTEPNRKTTITNKNHDQQKLIWWKKKVHPANKGSKKWRTTRYVNANHEISSCFFFIIQLLLLLLLFGPFRVRMIHIRFYLAAILNIRAAGFYDNILHRCQVAAKWFQENLFRFFSTWIFIQNRTMSIHFMRI